MATIFDGNQLEERLKRYIHVTTASYARRPANRVLRRDDLLSHVWHNENDGHSRTVDVHIRRLRMKLGAAGGQFQTVPRVGYRFSEN